MYSKVAAASVAKKTCGWWSSATLCYVVSALVRLLSLWEVPMVLQGRIPCLSSKESPNTLLQAAELIRAATESLQIHQD
jgi:hypothetical protein